MAELLRPAQGGKRAANVYFWRHFFLWPRQQDGRPPTNPALRTRLQTYDCSQLVDGAGLAQQGGQRTLPGTLFALRACRLLNRYRSYRHHEVKGRFCLMELASNIHALDAFAAFLVGSVRMPTARRVLLGAPAPPNKLEKTLGAVGLFQDDVSAEHLRAALDAYQQGAWSMVEASVLAAVQGTSGTPTFGVAPLPETQR